VCRITTSAGCMDAQSVIIPFMGSPPVPQLSISPASSVAVGTTVSIAWTVDNSAILSTIDATTIGNQPTPAQCNSKVCSANYITKTAGLVGFIVQVYCRCGAILTC